MSQLNDMDTTANEQASTPTWFRGIIQGKTRIILAWAFAFVLGFTAREYPAWPGIVVCFFGAALRYWASGYLRKDTRPAVGGPYSFVRNPLYLGTYLMAFGAVWAIQNWPLLLFQTVTFAVIYHYIILDEETKLHRIFQGSYPEYCEKVPRFFPRIWPPLAPAPKAALLQINPEQAHLHFSHALAMKNKAYEAFASFAGLIGYEILAAYLWKLFS